MNRYYPYFIACAGAGAAVAQGLAGQSVVTAVALGLIVIQMPIRVVLLVFVSVRLLTDSPLLDASLGVSTSALNSAMALGILVLALGRLCTRPTRSDMLLTLGLGVPLSLSFLNGVLQWGVEPTLIAEFTRELSLVGAALLALSLPPDKAAWLLRSLPYGLLLPAVVALAQGASGGARAASTFAHPNAAAVAFGIGSVLCFHNARAYDRPRYRALGAMLLLAVVTTGSMAGFAAVVVGLGVLSTTAAGRSAMGATRTRKMRFLLVAAVAVSAFALSPVGSQRLAELSSTRSISAVESGQTTNSLDWRFYNWNLLFDSWRENPVLGHGLGSTIELVQPGRNLPHNEYLRYLVELGGALYLWVLIALLMLVRSTRSQSTGTGPRMRLVISLLALAAVSATAANTFLYTSASYLMAVSLAAAYAANGKFLRATCRRHNTCGDIRGHPQVAPNTLEYSDRES